MKLDQWYKFECQFDRDVFIKRARRMGARPNEESDPIDSADCLRISRDNHGHLIIRYRSVYRTKYEDLSPILYDKEEGVYMPSNKCCEDRPCRPEEPMMNDSHKKDYLVDVYFNKKQKELLETKRSQERAVVEKCDCFKPAKEFAELANKHRIDGLIDPHDMIGYDMFDDKMKKEMKSIASTYESAMNDLCEKCRRISNLINQADSFKERYNLMVASGILEELDVDFGD